MTEMVRLPEKNWTEAAYPNLVFSINSVNDRMLEDPGRDGTKTP
jgi:hypothetical protein